MALHVALYHKTHYTYDKPVCHGPHVVRLRPAPHCRTRILSYSHRIGGGEPFVNWLQDPFANWNARLVFPEMMSELLVEVELVAEMAVYNPFDFFLEDNATYFPFKYDEILTKDLHPFLEAIPASALLTDYLNGIRSEILGHPETVPHAATPDYGHKLDTHHDGGHIPAPGSLPDLADASQEEPSKASKKLRTIDLLVSLNQRVQKDVGYVIRLEPGVQTPDETLAKRTGSCRDSAWLLVQVMRHLGLAARFVSGYLIQLAPDVKPLDGPTGTSKDFTDLHAWCEVYLPGAGWVGLDPTSGLLAGEGHLPLSCTPEPSTAAPVSGAVDPCKSTLHHEMRITRIFESPRVTKPYTPEQWEALDSLGKSIDEELQRGDVRLTMGGEPTFVSIDNPDGPEWNFTAGSQEKRVLSGTLIKRLQQRFAPGALLHYGQGKWYPGEQLPRWTLAACWRKDGVPIWNDYSLIADESKNYGHGPREARELIACIAKTLAVNPDHILPGYEDVFYYTWKERRLPSNVTAEKSNLIDKLERDRIARIFQKGIGQITGFALPIRRESTGWESGAWFLRDDDILWLIPGDSPMGLRLPLDSIPWVAEKDFPWLWQKDPSIPLSPLPSLAELRQRFVTAQSSTAFRGPTVRNPDADSMAANRGNQPGKPGDPRMERPTSNSVTDPNQRPLPGQSAPWIIRTAVCVEPRDGRLHVFMPPVSTTEDYLELITGVETAVSELGMPVIIEGDAPPRDPRINKLAITPDPGVIEVNLHPSASWDELVDRTKILYEEARLTRLGTEKFMLDGRHGGTGGGNHIIIGGATPSDSPILRRPDLLRSLLAYWQNHPSLSWLFSGQFIGPTSQAPRIDEARNDSLYELELAFKEMSRKLPSPVSENSVPPWLVDRLFRNLLIDSSGNTHRSEFSIDKLFSPESASGRLGLVEMRGFEMPPHAEMSLAQHLLLRGLIARFWRQPYTNNLVRWGTDLHDRWMLPHFCETDFRDVLSDLREAGYPFEMDWFAPHFEFRFPRVGDFAQRDVFVELRTALEPWHVLGEEAGGGGTVRYVDSSLERIQVKVRGLIGDRFQIICNGHRVPLHPTGTNGEAVAGIRYRAWQPPECLHPTIEVHTPLVLDLFDTWNGRSLGGCSYHVAHPGGRSHETFPVNAYEAESRRLARFNTLGHHSRTISPPNTPLSRECPFTLDLRAH